jgi:uncharacterized protein (DUF169 family)
METKLSDTLKLKYPPVVLYWSDTAPEKAVQFGKGKMGCVLFLFSSAAKGKAAVCDRETFGCFGGGVGMGFNNQYLTFPGGIDCFCRFLSTGNEGFPQGEAVAGHMKGQATEKFVSDFLHGERYIKTPEGTQRFVNALPMVDIPKKYAVFAPLSVVQDDPGDEEERIVTLIADPDQLSALVVLANFVREGIDAVTIPFVAGCQAIGIMALREAKSDNPKAVVGLVDISARVNTKTSLGRGLFTFSVPWKMFMEMERDAPNSFLYRNTWKELMGE